MSLFGKKSPSPAGTPAPRSVIGTVGSLFNPRIGDTIRPLGETGKMLTMIIAMVFVANGLFPRNHPALLPNSKVRLSFPEVISIGWSNVKFSRDTIPQTLVFFAVILSLGCSALAIISGIFALMTGTAHAQNAPTGVAMFEPPPLDRNDIACGWINWLFDTNAFGCQVGGANDYLAATGQTVANLQSTAIQDALIVALGFYSDVILVIAAVVLFYHLTAMIVETAHHGVIMGRRANQVWAPIRLVVAVGLLVPIASGLNSGQFIVIQIAQWSTMVASNAWSIFLQTLATDANNALVPPMAPIVRQEVADLMQMYACMTAFNNISCNGGNQQNGAANTCGANAGGCQNPLIQDPSQNPSPNNPEVLDDQSRKYSFTPKANGGNGAVSADYKDLCGYYIQNADIQATGVEQQLAQQIQQAGRNAFNATLPAIRNFGTTEVLHFLKPLYCGTDDQAYPVNNQYEQVMAQLYINLQNNLNGVRATLAQAMNAAVVAAQQEGWVGAGSWFNTVARLQGDVTDLAHDFPYKTAPPQVQSIVQSLKAENPGFDMHETVGKLNGVMDDFTKWMNREVNQANPAANGLSPEQQQVELAQSGIVANNGAGKTHMMDLIFQAIDYIAARDGVWQAASTQCVGTGSAACFSLGVQFTNANPLAEIAAFGHSNLNTAYDVFDDYLVFTGLVSVSSEVANAMGGVAALRGTGRFSLTSMIARVFGATATAGSQASSSIGDVIGMIVVVFFTGGFMLAFFLPLIPFYRFMFGTLSWFLSLLESVIAIPLVALAHLTPEGEGFMGDKAKGAYYFIFHLFLRPTLMVFGLIVGYLLFCIAASLMNLLYTTAVAAAGGYSSGHYTLARIVYSIIYIVILYLSCNKCFQLIDWLPEHAMKWMGAQGLQHAPMGNPEEIGNYMGLASGYMEQKIVAGAGAVAKSPMGGAVVLADMNRRGLTGGVMSEIEKVSPRAAEAAQGALNKAGQFEQAVINKAEGHGSQQNMPQIFKNTFGHEPKHDPGGETN